jgi:uridine phosphorylase
MKYWVTAERYIDYYTKLKGISTADIGVGSVVVLSWAPGVVKRMAEQSGAQPSEHWPMQSRYPLFYGEMQGIRVSFCQVTIGAPGTISQMEQMIACGARVFLGLGWAGSLNPCAPVHSMLVPTTCIREEGTSYHYLGQDAVVQANPHLVKMMIEAAQEEGVTTNSGPHWTTDAIYREGEGKINAYREMGVLGVDMETSAMYALGAVYDVAVSNLLVVSDSLWGEWKMSFHTEQTREATIRGENVILRALDIVVEEFNNGVFEDPTRRI